MASGATLAVLGTLGGAAITGLVSYYTTKAQTEAADRRREAEFYLEKKVDALTELHYNLSKIYNKTIYYVEKEGDIEDFRNKVESLSESQMEELEEVADLTNRGIELTERASIYLDFSDKRKILEYIRLSNKINRLVTESSLDEGAEIDEIVDFEEYAEKRKNALNVLEEEMNEPIDRLGS